MILAAEPRLKVTPAAVAVAKRTMVPFRAPAWVNKVRRQNAPALNVFATVIEPTPDVTALTVDTAVAGPRVRGEPGVVFGLENHFNFAFAFEAPPPTRLCGMTR